MFFLKKHMVFSNVDHITFGTFSPTALAALLIAALKSSVDICPLASSTSNFHISFVVHNVVNKVSIQLVAECQTAAAYASVNHGVFSLLLVHLDLANTIPEPNNIGFGKGAHFRWSHVDEWNDQILDSSDS